MMQNKYRSPESVAAGARRWWLLLAAGALGVLLVWRSVTQQSQPDGTAPAALNATGPAGVAFAASHLPGRADGSASVPTPTAAEIVAAKVAQFARSRRALAHELARRHGVKVPGDAERFFDAIEAGDWQEIDRQFAVLSKSGRQYEDSTTPDSPRLDPVWSAVLDAYGAAEQAHLWPAQKLLDYGNAILDSLRPGMIYVGGTDNGRWIPELLNETSGDEPHVILTQNALADARYLDYLGVLYGGRLNVLNGEDSSRAFQDYLADAQRRLEHDQQFPNEAKQLRPGEDVTLVDGKVQVSGQVAVMSINEKLLRELMAKNPDRAIALQESSPLPGTYAGALPLGPVMELEALNGQTAFTPGRAAQSLDYWRNTAQQLLSDPEAANSPETLKAYSHDTVAAANLLAAHDFNSEAEQAYRLAAQLWPENPESVGRLADLLARNGREEEARRIFESYVQKYPGQRKELDQVSASWRLLYPPPNQP